MNAKPLLPEAVMPGRPQHVALASLKPGHEHPDGDINSRKYGRNDVADLVPTIRQFGVIVPLVVKPHGRDLYVVAGNRRLVALREIFPQKDWGVVQVPTIEAGAGDPLELSMLENSVRRDLHPVDQYEVFQILVQAGATIEELAAKYLLKPAQVRQALGLAKLAPEVREAWRSDKIDDATAEAFLMTSDHAVQAKVLKKGGKDITSWKVRRDLGADNSRVDGMLKLVGRKQYEAAGHFVNESLFAESDRDSGATVSDYGALKVMVADLVEAQCAKLIEEGWAWAIPKTKAPNDLHGWKRVHPGGNQKFAADVMKAAGCVVDLDPWNGSITISRGYVKPGSKVQLPKGATQTTEQKKAAAKKKRERAENGPAVSNALAHRLSRALTLAAEDVLATNPNLALAVALAALACGNSPMNIKIEDRQQGEWRKVDDRYENDFEKYLALALDQTTDETLRALATWVAQSVDLTCWRADSLPMAPTKGKVASRFTSGEPDLALLKAMPPDEITKALRSRFDAVDYFASMSAEACRAALADMGLTIAREMKKSELAAQAGAVAKTKGWLPRELRVPGAYDGPGVKPVSTKPAKPAGKAKKKARR